MRLRVYQVHDGEPSESCVAVVARNAREAKRLGYLYGDIGCEGWTEMRAVWLRAAPLPPGVDGPGVVAWESGHEISRWYRARGWHEGNHLPDCEGCGLYQFDSIPESWVSPETGLCGECMHTCLKKL